MSATNISFGLLIVLFMILLLYLDTEAETTGSRVRSAKDVPVLRMDHVSIKGKLPGVRRSQFSKAVSVRVEQ